MTTMVAVLATGALCLAAVAGGKKQVTRDFAIRGTVYCEITGIDAAGTASFNILGAEGVATHTGRYNLSGSGQLNLITGVGSDEGVFYAANGDQLFWHGDIYPDAVTYAPKLEVTVDPVDPGTGRFADASGGFLADLFDVQVDLVGGTMTFSFTGSGELTY